MMDRFYPNFYSLQSAPAEPLDPRFKRRSWTLGLGGQTTVQQHANPQSFVRSQRASSEARVSTFLPEPRTPVAVVKPNCGIINPVALRPQYGIPMCMQISNPLVNTGQYFPHSESMERITLSRPTNTSTLPRRPKPELVDHYHQQQQQQVVLVRLCDNATKSLNRRHSLFDFPTRIINYGPVPAPAQPLVSSNQLVDRQTDLTLRRRARRRIQQNSVGTEPVPRRHRSFYPSQPSPQQPSVSCFNYVEPHGSNLNGGNQFEEEFDELGDQCRMQTSHDADEVNRYGTLPVWPQHTELHKMQTMLNSGQITGASTLSCKPKQSDEYKLQESMAATAMNGTTLPWQPKQLEDFSKSNVVSAFEHSLANMAQRLQSLTMSAAEKDSELQELRQLIESMRQERHSSMSHQNGSSSCNGMMRMTSSMTASGNTAETSESDSSPRRWIGEDGSKMSYKKPHSASGLSASCTSPTTTFNSLPPPKKNNWLRNSFGKAFKKQKGSQSSLCETDLSEVSQTPSEPQTPQGGQHLTVTMSPLETCNGFGRQAQMWSPMRSASMHPPRTNGQHLVSNGSMGRHKDVLIRRPMESELEREVNAMRQELVDREAKLTDAQLQALASAHQVDQLRDQLALILEEVSLLRAENRQLRRSFEATNSANQICMDNGSIISSTSPATSTPNPSNIPHPVTTVASTDK